MQIEDEELLNKTGETEMIVIIIKKLLLLIASQIWSNLTY